ncbi:MAG: hypothetical protein AB8U93_06135 [Francisella endosymbiont of Hyalomma scupense]
MVNNYTVLGWCIISAKGTYTIPFGLPSITPVLPRADVVKIKDIHEIFVYIGLTVIFVHAIQQLLLQNYYILRARFRNKVFYCIEVVSFL